MVALENKQYKEFEYFSRYQNTPYYFNKNDRKYIVGTTQAIQKDILYVLHKVKQGDNLDTLALYYYNNPTYFWIIADMNDIQNPYLPLIVGSEIKVPVFNEVKFDIGD